MKSIMMRIAVMVLFNLAIDGIKAQTKEQLNIALSNPAKPFRLSLRLQQGTIQISSYSGNTVQVEAIPITGTTGSRSDTNQNRNQNQNTNTNSNINYAEPVAVNKAVTGGKYITATESSNSVTITPIAPKQKLAVVVWVPKNKGTFHFSSMLHTDITATNLTGEIDITNNLGQIILTNIAGSAVVSNVAGHITVSFTSISENTPMAFSTVAGIIDVSFPASLKANLKVNSDNGKLFSDFQLDCTSGSSQPQIKRNSQGQYHAEMASGLSCRIGGGGNDIRFKNMEGNIYIRKSK